MYPQNRISSYDRVSIIMSAWARFLRPIPRRTAILVLFVHLFSPTLSPESSRVCLFEVMMLISRCLVGPRLSLVPFHFTNRKYSVRHYSLYTMAIIGDTY